MADELLFWSSKGEVACAIHAPAENDPRRTADRWQPIPFDKLRKIRYQCQHCTTGQPIRHQSLKSRAPLVPVVLNVDDRPASLYWRERSLRMHGFAVKNAATGESALNAARQFHPHLILLDVHLPDIDGRDVCKRLKADQKTAAIPVVLISATLAQRGERLHDLRVYSADGYIPEPCEGAALAETLWKVLKDGASYPR
jgi:CheY-like chemotaxis protein